MDIHFSFLFLVFILIVQAIFIKFKLHSSLEKKIENKELEVSLLNYKDNNAKNT